MSDKKITDSVFFSSAEIQNRVVLDPMDYDNVNGYGYIAMWFCKTCNKFRDAPLMKDRSNPFGSGHPWIVCTKCNLLKCEHCVTKGRKVMNKSTYALCKKCEK